MRLSWLGHILRRDESRLTRGARKGINFPLHYKYRSRMWGNITLALASEPESSVAAYSREGAVEARGNGEEKQTCEGAACELATAKEKAVRSRAAQGPDGRTAQVGRKDERRKEDNRAGWKVARCVQHQGHVGGQVVRLRTMQGEVQVPFSVGDEEEEEEMVDLFSMEDRATKATERFAADGPNHTATHPEAKDKGRARELQCGHPEAPPHPIGVGRVD